MINPYEPTPRYKVKMSTVKVVDTYQVCTKEYSVEQWDAGRKLFEIFGNDKTGIARYLRYQFDMKLVDARILAEAATESSLVESN